MSKYLKQKGSGHIYPWTEILSQRDDMEPCELPAPVAETPVENPPVADELPPLDDAIEAFKRDVVKPGRKPKTGEA